uniref:Uncharacterized protein n=1 Tax=Sphaerodactylus townsendi TaxID=933632 RepID=A0ACB8G990_9SAUR
MSSSPLLPKAHSPPGSSPVPSLLKPAVLFEQIRYLPGRPEQESFLTDGVFGASLLCLVMGLHLPLTPSCLTCTVRHGNTAPAKPQGSPTFSKTARERKCESGLKKGPCSAFGGRRASGNLAGCKSAFQRANEGAKVTSGDAHGLMRW